MLSEDKILKETSPLSIFLVKSGSGGNRLLFRYPYDEDFHRDSIPEITSLEFINERDRLQLHNVISENDEALCNIFSVNPNLCGHKLEIKINNVRYVCHPMSLLTPTSQLTNGCNKNHDPCHEKPKNCETKTAKTSSSRARIHNCDMMNQCSNEGDVNQEDMTSFNIVFALRSSASYDIVDCFHDLSKRMAIALSSEEKRNSYLTREIKSIISAFDERELAVLNNRANRSNSAKSDKNPQNGDLVGEDIDQTNSKSIFGTILDRSGLAKDLKKIFIGITFYGVVELKINNWVHLSFCLPQKVHRLKLMTHKSMPAIGTRDIKRCLMYLRPYHGLLLLCDQQELLVSLPIDASPALIQLIRVAKPDKNFMDLSVDANLTLMQIFCIVSQLIYWAKATIIYPICDSNMYSIHPLASTGLKSELVHDFKCKFPNANSLHHYLARFSEGTSLSQLNGPLLNLEEKQNLLSIVAWLLQRRVITQIHKYIFMVIDELAKTCKSGLEEPEIQPDHTFGQSNILALEKAGLSQAAALSVLAIPSSRVGEDLKLLVSLMPYFNGKHHIEDIMFFENLDRSQVLILCDKFRDILLTCHYEDVAVSQLSPFNNKAR